MKLKYVPGGICAPTGFTAGATHCGVRPNKKKNDLAIILSDRNADCVSAGLYTAPPAQGPKIPEICGITPEARMLMQLRSPVIRTMSV